MQIVFSSVSCGVHQLWDLYHNPNDEGDLRIKLSDAFTNYRRYYPTAKLTSFIFSDNMHRGYGAALAKQLGELGLGPVIETGWFINNNSGARINIWVWWPDFQRLNDYLGWVVQVPETSLSPVIGPIEEGEHNAVS